MKHTPGPWVVHQVGDNDLALIGTEDGMSLHIFNTEDAVAQYAMGYTLADARLIAAAPELLERLKAAEQTLRNLAFGFLDGEANTIAHNEAANMRAVIAQAEGES